jgi:NAD(P)-dependent dehydrogenase (short-subunit alcohol dehydrogenase family)
MTSPTQTVLVTGATSGIGEATVHALLARGHRVFATGRNEAALARLGRLQGVEALTLDVTDPASIEAAVTHLHQATAGKGVDVLINNAGFGVVAPLVEVSDDDLRAQFETNVFGLLAVTRAFLPALRRSGRGKVVNVGSVGGRMTLPFLASYNATKYAVESISDGLRAELHPMGIKVVLVEPGVINTGFNARATRDLDGYLASDSEFNASLQHAHASMARAERFGVGPQRVADTLARIVGIRRPRARYVTPRRTLLALWLTRVLPTSWVDFAMRRVSGIKGQFDAPALPAG